MNDKDTVSNLLKTLDTKISYLNRMYTNNSYYDWSWSEGRTKRKEVVESEQLVMKTLKQLFSRCMKNECDIREISNILDKMENPFIKLERLNDIIKDLKTIDNVTCQSLLNICSGV